jgi:2-oxoglutarate dehydrogenase E2 component (dihydrolipoamide succinyltransferase)
VGASATTQTEQRTVEAGQGSDGHDQEVAASPVARRMAAANNVDLAGVQGSGPGGRVVKGDVAAQLHQGEQQAAPAPVPAAEIAPALKPAPAPAPTPRPQPAPAPQAAPQAAQPDRREERIRMTRRRQTIARRLVEAQHNAAMLTTFNEIDMSAIMALRKRRGEAFLKRYDVKLGFMSFFTKAAVGALKAFPMLNAEIQGDEFVVKHYYDIGIAVGVEEGLVVPVVRDADRKSFAQLEREIGELAKRAREGTLGLNDLQGGTFTITNGGVYGSLMSTPILNAPQVGILGMHKTQERPVVVNGEVVVRPMMYIALSYDHRIVDGSEAVRFLVRVKELAEDPESLLLEG